MKSVSSLVVPAALVAIWCAQVALADRLSATRNPTVHSTRLGCKALPQYQCWASETKSLLTTMTLNTTDVGACCAACGENKECAAYNFHASAGLCELFRAAGQSVALEHNGCAAGYAPQDQDSPSDGHQPNIVFLVVESTDGRTWSPGYQNDVIPMPNIRKLQKGGIEFQHHYSNAPVCCPSRATFWSGRHAHNIPHTNNGIAVGGAWNNYEGLPLDYKQRMDQVMSNEGYNVKVSGKTDWSVGSHSENVRLSAWTMYTQFPYNISRGGGWNDETGCVQTATVKPGGGVQKGSAHKGDWETAKETTAWIAEAAKKPAPFFVYQGMNIVHPPYVTNSYWSGLIARDKVEVPEWLPYEQMHPCDLQSSMLKGCTPSEADAPDFFDKERRRNIRAVYYAMIAEFDAMVGLYMSAVDKAGVSDRTVFIVTSDHGDMQMEKQQFYKMVPYEASASVPMVVYDGRPGRQFASRKVVRDTTQLIDIFPTVLDLAGVPKKRWPKALEGRSFASYMGPAIEAPREPRPSFVVSQFHGDNIAMSWFLVVQTGLHVPAGPGAPPSDTSVYKLIIWGTGEQVPSLLFDLEADPSEEKNLIGTKEGAARYASIVTEMTQNLQSVVDYKKVAVEVATYNHDSFLAYANRTQDWETEMHHKGLRWDKSWQNNPDGALAAVKEWMAAPVAVRACRNSTTWP